jgi:hypothetical protein
MDLAQGTVDSWSIDFFWMDRPVFKKETLECYKIMLIVKLHHLHAMSVIRGRKETKGGGLRVMDVTILSNEVLARFKCQLPIRWKKIKKKQMAVPLIRCIKILRMDAKGF